MADFNLVFNTEKNYLFYFFVTAQSIVDALDDRSTNGQDKIIFHVLIDEGVDQAKAEAYRESFLKFNESAKVGLDLVFYRLDSSLFSTCITMKREGRDTHSVYYRLLFASFLPQNVDRVLYLDVDIFVNADVRQLFEQCPMQDELVYATSDPCYFILSKNPFEAEPQVVIESVHADGEPIQLPVKEFLQSGVLLINVKQWRQQNIGQKSLEMSNQWKWHCHDQDILSVVCKGQISEMPLDWNVAHFLYLQNLLGGHFYDRANFFPVDKLPFRTPVTREYLRSVCANPKLVHFSGTFKPWVITRQISAEDRLKYKESIPYMMRWLQVYGRLANFFKGH